MSGLFDFLFGLAAAVLEYRGMKHICWDGCMYANDILENAETWNHVLKAMIEVDAAL